MPQRAEKCSISCSLPTYHLNIAFNKWRYRYILLCVEMYICSAVCTSSVLKLLHGDFKVFKLLSVKCWLLNVEA